jgi:hypothetical protein
VVTLNDPDLYRLLTCHVPNLVSVFHCSFLTVISVQARGKYIRFVTRLVFKMRNYWHLAQPPSWRTTPCRVLIQYIRSYPPIGGRSSIRDLRTRHAVVTGTHIPWALIKYKIIHIYICVCVCVCVCVYIIYIYRIKAALRGFLIQ